MREGGGGGGGLSRNVFMFYVQNCIEVFLEIPHDAAQEKNFDVFIFPLSTNMCYKIVA